MQWSRIRPRLGGLGSRLRTVGCLSDALGRASRAFWRSDNRSGGHFGRISHPEGTAVADRGHENGDSARISRDFEVDGLGLPAYVGLMDGGSYSRSTWQDSLVSTADTADTRGTLIIGISPRSMIFSIFSSYSSRRLGGRGGGGKSDGPTNWSAGGKLP